MAARASIALLVSFLSGAVAILAACTGEEPPPASATPSDGGAGGFDATGADTGGPSGQIDGSAGPTDAGAGDASDGAPPRFCAGKSAPPGFADFFCADFDGVPFDEGFTTKYTPDGGALERTTSVLYSPPASLTNRNNAFAGWSKAAGMAVAEVELALRINPATVGGAVPPATGSTKIFVVNANTARVELRYTRGGTVEGVEHAGYYISAVNCPGPCALAERKLPALPLDVWTEVTVSWTKAGAIKVSYGAASVLAFNALAFTSTTAAFELGVIRLSDSPTIGRVAFDDVRFAVRRE